jgi:hypothetical protein
MPTGDEDPQGGARGDEADHYVGTSFEQVLAGVEEEQHAPLPDCRGQVIGRHRTPVATHTHCVRDRIRHGARQGKGKVNNESAIAEFGFQPTGCLQSKPRLADARGSSERHLA